MIHLDLFSGIGGFTLACEWAGIETIGFVEIDKYCQKVLRKHWPDVPIVEDIRDVEKIKEIVAHATRTRLSHRRGASLANTGEEKPESQRQYSLRSGIQGISGAAIKEREPAILITAGFPCQPFSVAGKQLSQGDDRYLWPQTLAVIKAIKPRWILLENVTGIINLALDTVLSDLEGAGYSYETLIIPACAVNAPHRRDRIWIVAYRRCEGIQQRWESANAFREGGELGRVQQNGLQEIEESKREDVGNTLSNGHKGGYKETRREKREGKQRGVCQLEGTSDVAIPKSRESRQSPESEGRKDTGRGSEEVTITLTEGNGIQGGESISNEANSGDWWAVEPELGGSPNGFPIWLYRHCGRGLSYEESIRRAKVLRDLWQEDVSKALWYATRGYDRMEQAEILFAFVCQYESDSNQAWILVESAKALVEFVFSLWEQGKLTSPPPRPKDRKQWEREYPDIVQTLPRLLAYTGKQDWQISSWEDAIPRVSKGIKNRVDRLKCLGNAIVPQVAYQIIKVIAEVERERRYHGS